MHVLYAIVYALAGVRPWTYHLLNVVLHMAAVLCVYQLARGILARWGEPARHPCLPLVAALVFSVHPVHTEPVEWVAGVTDLSYAAFGLLALFFYVGVLLARSGRSDEALAHFESAVRLAPENQEYSQNLSIGRIPGPTLERLSRSVAPGPFRDAATTAWP